MFYLGAPQKRLPWNKLENNETRFSGKGKKKPMGTMSDAQFVREIKFDHQSTLQIFTELQIHLEHQPRRNDNTHQLLVFPALVSYESQKSVAGSHTSTLAVTFYQIPPIIAIPVDCFSISSFHIYFNVFVKAVWSCLWIINDSSSSDYNRQTSTNSNGAGWWWYDCSVTMVTEVRMCFIITVSTDF